MPHTTGGFNAKTKTRIQTGAVVCIQSRPICNKGGLEADFETNGPHSTPPIEKAPDDNTQFQLLPRWSTPYKIGVPLQGASAHRLLAQSGMPIAGHMWRSNHFDSPELAYVASAQVRMGPM